jgi:hypothetical protein
LIKDSQTYGRLQCKPSNYYYEAIQVNVITAGSYTMLGTNNVNTYGCLYKDYFNPFDPSNNFLSCSNYECTDLEFRLVTYLESNATYVLVVATDHWKLGGTFTINTTGANTVKFKRFREYLPIKKKFVFVKAVFRYTDFDIKNISV